MRHVLTSSTGLQIWPFHVIVSKKTTKKCIKIKKARAGRVARVERAEKKSSCVQYLNMHISLFPLPSLSPLHNFQFQDDDNLSRHYKLH